MLAENYPRPDFIRPRWESLNGIWDFSTCSSKDFDFINADFESSINVPTSRNDLTNIIPDEHLSFGIYRKKFKINKISLMGAVILNISALSGDAEIFVNDKLLVRRKGVLGHYSYNITPVLLEGTNTLVFKMYADPSSSDKSFPCIPSNVWLEFTAKAHISDFRLISDFNDSSIILRANINNRSDNMQMIVEVSHDNGSPDKFRYDIQDKTIALKIPLGSRPKRWNIIDGQIYTVKMSLLNSEAGICDIIHTYVAFRDLTFTDGKLYLNGTSIFLRHAILNDPDIAITQNAEIIRQYFSDIMLLGFNGIKTSGVVPSKTFLYLADKLGLTINVGIIPKNYLLQQNSETELAKATVLSHIYSNLGNPSIFIWTPFENINLSEAVAKDIYATVKSLDPTRLISTNCGGYAYATDVFDKSLSYCSADTFKASLFSICNYHIIDGECVVSMDEQKPGVMPFDAVAMLPLYIGHVTLGDLCVSEDGSNKTDATEEQEFLDKYEQMTDTMYSSKAIGFAYESLYDSFRKTGLYRRPGEIKLSRNGLLKIRQLNSKTAFSEIPPVPQSNPAQQQQPTDMSVRSTNIQVNNHTEH